MRVAITGTRSGIDGARVDWPPIGEVLECDDAEAQDLLAGGMASTEADWAEYLRLRAAEHAERLQLQGQRTWV